MRDIVKDLRWPRSNGLDRYPHEGDEPRAVVDLRIRAANEIESLRARTPEEVIKRIPLYVAEAQFKYNNRNNPDIFGAAMAGA